MHQILINSLSSRREISGWISFNSFLISTNSTIHNFSIDFVFWYIFESDGAPWRRLLCKSRGNELRKHFLNSSLECIPFSVLLVWFHAWGCLDDAWQAWIVLWTESADCVWKKKVYQFRWFCSFLFAIVNRNFDLLFNGSMHWSGSASVQVFTWLGREISGDSEVNAN